MMRGAWSWLRAAAIGLVVSAPFLPPISRDGKAQSIVYVVDRSASVGEEAREAAEHYVRSAFIDRDRNQNVGVVAFASHADVVLPLGGSILPPIAATGPGGSRPPLDVQERDAWGSDIAAGVRLAAAAMPTSGRRRVVLLTDARPTRGDALAEVERVRREGIQVDVVPIGGKEQRGVPTLASVHPRSARVAEGEPAVVTAKLRGTPNGYGLVHWSRDGQDLAAKTMVRMDASGEGEATFTDAHPGSGVHVYRAHLVDHRQGALSREVLTAVTVEGKPRAIVVTIDGECPALLSDALAKAQIDKRIVTLSNVPDAASLSGADLVVLADVPLSTSRESTDGLTARAQEALIDYAQNGGGLIVTGGPFGFAPEYAGAPLSRMLPVEVEDKGQMEDPPVALAIMLDRSGSMGAWVGTHTKIQLAVEAALAAASTLRPSDMIAIASIDEETHWNEPLGRVTDVEARRSEIRRITAGGGGIYVFTALRDAYAALAGANAPTTGGSLGVVNTTPIRHVILFSDTADSEQQTEDCVYRIDGAGACSGRSSQQIAREARSKGITTSVVGIGREEEQDTPFLRELAAAAGGRFYLTTDGSDLRRIFVSETRVAARSNLHEGMTAVKGAADHPALAGVDVQRLPALAGFVETKRRATADTAIVTREDDRPILASWRYGLGKVAALTTDLRGDWKGGWARYRDAGQVLRQTVRYTLREQSAQPLDMRVSLRERNVEITLDAPEVRDAKPPATIEAYGVDADGALHRIDASATRVAPGQWLARGKSGGEALVLVRARDAAGALVAEAVGQGDAATELEGPGVDDRVARQLARAGGGLYDPDPLLTLRSRGPVARERLRTWPWALVAAAILACIDLWVRRIATRPHRSRVAELATERPPLAPATSSAPAG
jgi:uncharacterized membrane protein